MTGRSPRRVVLWCDAGRRHGVGHVMRCLALAEELADRGAEIVFVADLADIGWAREELARRGFTLVAPPSSSSSDRAAAGVDEVAALAPSLVVVDSYVAGRDFYERLRDRGLPVLALVDGDPGERPADLWLDQNLGAEDDAWPVPARTTRLAGLDYALMRTEILAARPTTPERAEREVPRLFVLLGGTDALGTAPQVLRAILGTGRPLEVTVVVASPAIAEECRALATAPGQVATLVEPTTSVATLAVDADLVVSAAGSSSWELLCLGAAAALVCVAPNQATSYARAVREGLVAGLGDLEDLRADPAGASGVLAELLDSPARRRELRERGRRRVDGRGRRRVADACEALLADREATSGQPG